MQLQLHTGLNLHFMTTFLFVYKSSIFLFLFKTIFVFKFKINLKDFCNQNKMSNNLLLTPIEYLKALDLAEVVCYARTRIHKYSDLLNSNRYIDRTQYYKINEIQNNVADYKLLAK
jgi:hypothetical protein